VSFGAPLFVENSAKETPCDCAEKAGHAQIALYLESKMVFSVSVAFVFTVLHCMHNSIVLAIVNLSGCLSVCQTHEL